MAASVPPTAAAPRRQRLAGLDGIRGLAALYVVINHVFLRAFPGYPVDHAPFWAGWFIYGRFAVVVFIVLSGFSLALSPARHGWRLDAVSQFAQRRARRILPAYWAALAFSLAVAWLIVPQPGHGMPDAKSVLVNGLLVQNIVGAHSPNAAFWSMAVEAQLYLAVPAAAADRAPAGRHRHGRHGHAGRGGGRGLRPAHRAPGHLRDPVSARPRRAVRGRHPDRAASSAPTRLAGRGRGHWLALAAVAPVLATIWWQGSVWTLDHLFWVDLALGPAIACLLAGLATGRPAPLLRCSTRGRCAASARLLQPVPDACPDRRHRLRADRRRPGPPGRSGVPRLARPGAAADDRVRAGVRVGLRGPVQARSRLGRACPTAPRSQPEGCRDEPDLWAWGRVVGPARDARRPGLAPRHGPVPRRHPHGRRPGAGGGGSHRGADHGVRCLAVEDRGPGSRRELSLPAAVAAYYRSIFLNVTLPGGIVGDVHRGISHGRDVRDVGRALRAVAWERSAGQVVQIVLTVVVLLVLPSPVHSSMPLVAIAVVVAAVGRRRSWPGRDPPTAGPRGRGCAAPWPATSATRCSPGERGRPSRSRPRWSSPATRSPS